MKLHNQEVDHALVVLSEVRDQLRTLADRANSAVTGCVVAAMRPQSKRAIDWGKVDEELQQILRGRCDRQIVDELRALLRKVSGQ